ncbi:hypothetical protein LSH36_2145g00020 [Paralvinella palmiformis]|uniref:Sulfatase N-terminal domain-containing protein n=1 Tax=Paralvinella palmiformis TaxID=53620 RepID=A0AAD9IS33_9ANNE|nr:hypothetical protein LSH36_2145g00020 [Paralvinella palmiformis]
MKGKGHLRLIGLLLMMGVLIYTTTYFRLAERYGQFSYLVPHLDDDDASGTDAPDEDHHRGDVTEIPLDGTTPDNELDVKHHMTTIGQNFQGQKLDNPTVDEGYPKHFEQGYILQKENEKDEELIFLNDEEDDAIVDIPPGTLNYSNILDSSSEIHFPRVRIKRPQIRSTPKRKNILFLVVDDLRPQINPYKDFPNLFPDNVFGMHTPNIDALARHSLILTRAYVQYSSCNPSRASYMTSRHPDTTKVWNLATFWRQSGGNFTTIPQFFGQRGYRTTGMGKIFHPGPGGGFNDPESWNDGYYIAPHGGYWSSKNTTADFWKTVNIEEREVNPLPDEELTINAINRLRKYAPKALTGEEPFFIALGYLKPHIPIVIPEEFLNLYPLKKLSMPNNNYLPKNFPPEAWMPPAEVLNCADVNLTDSRTMNVIFPEDLTRTLRRAYFAGVSYIDYLIGIVLSELESLGLAENTIVSFLGDHGWHLGEQGYWGKHTNFDLGVHTPLMIHIPGRTDHGLISESIIEFTDIFPTFVEMTGFGSLDPCPTISGHIKLCTEGKSFLKLFEDPQTKIRDFAFSQHRMRGHDMGYTVRTDRYRYTETVMLRHEKINNGLFQFHVKWDNPLGVELYDHLKDPQESENIVADPEYSQVVNNLRQALHTHFLSPITNLTKPFVK